jgi:hypothetical protein
MQLGYDYAAKLYAEGAFDRFDLSDARCASVAPSGECDTELFGGNSDNESVPVPLVAALSRPSGGANRTSKAL